MLCLTKWKINVSLVKYHLLLQLEVVIFEHVTFLLGSRWTSEVWQLDKIDMNQRHTCQKWHTFENVWLKSIHDWKYFHVFIYVMQSHDSVLVTIAAWFYSALSFNAVDLMYRVGQKSEVTLTTHVFKTTEPICIIFGALQHCFILNTICIDQIYNTGGST